MKKIYVPVYLIVLTVLLSDCKKSETITLPELSTSPVTAVNFTSAITGGDITSDGHAAVTARGVCWNTASNPTVSDSKTSDGEGTGLFVSDITGITAGTPYYVRAYATNNAGTGYGNEVTFTTTPAQHATLSTVGATAVTATTASSGGDITDDGGSNISARGVCWSTTTGPTIADTHTSDGTGKGAFTSGITGLTASTPYYVRAYATNSTGTAYGNEVSFTTSPVQGANNVSIQSMAFNPSSLTVPLNSTVKWTNNDAISHTVTSDAILFNSGTLTPGSSFSFQFTTAGTYHYHCSIHPEMIATITVQ